MVLFHDVGYFERRLERRREGFLMCEREYDEQAHRENGYFGRPGGGGEMYELLPICEKEIDQAPNVRSYVQYYGGQLWRS